MTSMQIVLSDVDFIARIRDAYKTVAGMFERRVTPLFDLGIRVWMAEIFFGSGLTKIANWENTVFLFELEYQVPLLPPAWAAAFATGFELAMPVLLVLGLATRFAALPLLSMALVIQFVLGAQSAAYNHVTHYYWMILLLMIVLRGAGTLSVDHWIKRYFDRQN